MAILRVNVVLPERSNTFFNAMADLLPKQIFNVDPEFMIPRLEPVAVNGTVVPFATVKVFINDIDKSPVPDIVADANGAWSGTFLLTPGQNTIQVQFFPPEASGDIENAYAPTLFVRNVLVHPTLFSPFPMQNTLQMLLLDGSYLYLGNFIPPPVNTKTIARFNIATGASTILDMSSGSPLSGRVYFMALDTNWLYVSQTMGDASIKVSRYAKDLSARLDNTGYVSVPNALYSDGTNLFVVRSPGDILLSKLNPTTMALVGSEISIKNGAIFENAVGHNAMGDDGTNLMIPTSRLIAGDSPGNDILAGSPDLGGNLIFNNLLFHRKVVKSTLTPGSFSTTLYTGTNSPDEVFVGKNSMVRFGGYWYSLVMSNPGKVIKMQEVTLFGQPGLEAIEVTPLPFSAVDSEHDLPTRMKLGPDSRLYVVGNAGIARFTPSSTSIQWMPRGAQSIDVTGTDVAVVDDTVPTRAIDAAPAIFTDRAQTFTVVAPTVAPTNLRCHFNKTHTHFAVGWTPMTDGNGVIIEYDVNGGGYAETAREYFGSGHVIPAGSFISGDTFSFRTRSFNSVGSSAPSASASFTFPFLTPPLGNPLNLVSTSVVGNTVSLEWEDHEIVLGGPVDATTNRSHHLYIYRSTDNMNFTQVGVKSLVVTTTQPDGSPIGGAFYYNPLTRANTLVQFSDTNAGAYPYYYKVRHVQGSGPSLSFGGFVYGPSSFSNVIQTDAPPATPINVAWEAGWEGALASWAPGVGGGVVTGYTVKRSTDNSVSYPTSFVVGNVTSYHDTTAFGNAQVRYDKIFATGPGGNSADSPIQGSVFSLAPVYHEVKIKNTDNINGPLLLDGSFAYAIASLSDGAIATTITKIDLTNSGNRTQNLAVYNPVGLSALVNSAVMFGGFIYILLKDNGEAFQRIIKVNPANLLQVGTFALATGNASGGLLVTDGTDCWAITGPSGSVKVTHFDPVAMSIILTGTSSFGAGVSTSSMGATAFGGKIFASIHNFNTATDYVIRVDATTLAIAETVSTSAVTFPGAMTNDGTNVYCHGGSGGQARIEKFSTGPLAFAASTANLGFVSQASLAYDSGSAAIYLAGRQTALVGGTNNSLMKVSTAPAFVSAISQVHFTDGTIDGTRTDGTYAYFSNNNGYVARELISSF